MASNQSELLSSPAHQAFLAGDYLTAIEKQVEVVNLLQETRLFVGANLNQIKELGVNSLAKLRLFLRQS
jgi:hypothetical protein